MNQHRTAQWTSTGQKSNERRGSCRKWVKEENKQMWGDSAKQKRMFSGCITKRKRKKKTKREIGQSNSDDSISCFCSRSPWPFTVYSLSMWPLLVTFCKHSRSQSYKLFFKSRSERQGKKNVNENGCICMCGDIKTCFHMHARLVCCRHACHTLKRLLQAHTHGATTAYTPCTDAVDGWRSWESWGCRHCQEVSPSVPLSSETRGAALTLSVCRSAGKAWSWGLLKNRSGVTWVHLFWASSLRDVPFSTVVGLWIPLNSRCGW